MPATCDHTWDPVHAATTLHAPTSIATSWSTTRRTTQGENVLLLCAKPATVTSRPDDPKSKGITMYDVIAKNIRLNNTPAHE
eukprot:CAMPEP_0178424712 /NCGR_PEP_ID=MMETSP0689_2-20121128/28353_1 /TAXON_ID=160604 /ORGANISM="Amphidinium massartii, Strain CS-259" /LENGTH=81 /DNA_ID=CAMNT_0020046361 /DNA_START=317 /DNA_END=562 /DNA_ORIENTATION=-